MAKKKILSFENRGEGAIFQNPLKSKITGLGTTNIFAYLTDIMLDKYSSKK